VSAMKLEDLLERLSSSAIDTTQKGSAFERLMASYLRTAPEFADRFEDVYLWQEWPGRGSAHDHGIDIVAKDITTGGWCAVQCKFYDPTHHVAKGDVDSFLAASSKKGFTSRIIVSTAKDWGPTIEKQLDNLTVPVVRIGVSDLLESKVDWASIDWTRPQQVLPTTGKKTALPHQREARTAVRDGLATHDRGQLVMACGTGKTFTSLKIAEELATGRKAEPDHRPVPRPLDPAAEPEPARVEAGVPDPVPGVCRVLRCPGRQDARLGGPLGPRPDLPRDHGHRGPGRAGPPADRGRPVHRRLLHLPVDRRRRPRPGPGDARLRVRATIEEIRCAFAQRIGNEARDPVEVSDHACQRA